MAAQDYVFLFSTENRNLGMAFCSMKELTKEEARDAVLTVLRQHKNLESPDLNYLGVMDYSDMDERVADQLHHFEKYKPVWLLFHN